MKNISILALLLAVSACASAGPAPSSEAQSAATSDIAEAVFRYQFQHNASSLQERADRYLPLPSR